MKYHNLKLAKKLYKKHNNSIVLLDLCFSLHYTLAIINGCQEMKLNESVTCCRLLLERLDLCFERKLFMDLGIRELLRFSIGLEFDLRSLIFMLSSSLGISPARGVLWLAAKTLSRGE